MTPFEQLTRRSWMQVGAAGVMGAALPSVARANSAHPAKSVIWVHLSGGPSQLDMWDPKPLAPDAIRGEFSAIDTAISGVHIGEHMPRLARMMKKWALVRTLSHGEGNHLLATHVALTGRPTPLPRGGSDLDRVQSRSDFPNMASAIDYLYPRKDGIPTGVSLPNYFIEGPLTWPGQYSGFLGMKHDPWQINQDPNADNFKVDSLALPAEVTPQRLVSRHELTSVLERENPMAGRATGFQEQQELAFSLLTSAKVTKAFEIQTESAETRDRYGRNKFGQSLLLARRLAEAGVPLIQAAMGIVQTWDTHVDNWGRLKNDLLPKLDQGLEALLTDLETSGLLDSTMVVVMGEFGRTPRISTLAGQSVPGRDHWPPVYSGLFAGAGIRGGQVLGQSDAQAAYPITRSWSPADVCSTIYQALGVDEHAELYDPLRRPHKLINGEVMEQLYTGT